MPGQPTSTPDSHTPYLEISTGTMNKTGLTSYEAPVVSHQEYMDPELDSKQRRLTSVPGQPALEAHGPAIDHKIPQDAVVDAQPDLAWSRIRRTFREPFAEFWGTFILIMFGDGVVAQVVLSNGTKGNFQSINWGWG